MSRLTRKDKVYDHLTDMIGFRVYDLNTAYDSVKAEQAYFELIACMRFYMIHGPKNPTTDTEKSLVKMAELGNETLINYSVED